jgi:translation initiation factor 2 alpha subunit (eIF-2alpha)
MSIAFLTLILGFLLGKSTSDRAHLIRDHLKRQNEADSVGSRCEYDFDKTAAELVSMARTEMMKNFKELYSDQHSTINNHIMDSFNQCLQLKNRTHTHQKVHETFEVFLKSFIDEEFTSFRTCIEGLKEVLRKINKN